MTQRTDARPRWGHNYTFVTARRLAFAPASARLSGVVDFMEISMRIRNRCASHIVIGLLLLCATTAMPSSAQTFTNVTRFDLTNGLEPGPLTLGTDGNFYGSTFFGGNLSPCGGYGCGTIFKLTPDGALTTLYSFNGIDGVNPERLVQGSDGNFYGMTFCSLQQGHKRLPLPAGNSRNKKSLPSSILFCDGPGSVFRISPNGSLVFLHTFDGADGWVGVGALVVGTDGNLYGASGLGGADQKGTIFKDDSERCADRAVQLCRRGRFVAARRAGASHGWRLLRHYPGWRG